MKYLIVCLIIGLMAGCATPHKSGLSITEGKDQQMTIDAPDSPNNGFPPDNPQGSANSVSAKMISPYTR